MLRTVLLCSVLFLLSGPARAQGSSDSVPSSVTTTIEQAVSVPNPLFVVEQVTHHQFVKGASPSFRRIHDISPPGNGNTAQITQIGEANFAALHQYGVQNIASLILLGDGNDLDAMQDGVGNLLDVSLLGDDNRIPITQHGTRLAMRLGLEVSNLRLQDPGIQQTGQGMSVIIEYKPGGTP